MAAKISLRVKCDGGQGVVRGLVPEDSLEKLISHSMEALGIVENSEEQNIKLLSGFPPKALDISDRDKSISSVGIRSGDTIIFQVSSSSSSVAAAGTSSQPNNSTKQIIQDGESQNKRMKTEPSSSTCSFICEWIVLTIFFSDPRLKLERKVVPADNSCLFTSINYCMSGTLVGSEHSAFMR